MFKMDFWKSPMFINPLIDKAQKAINKAIIDNHRIHNNDQLWLKVFISNVDDLPHIHVTDDAGNIYEKLQFRDLIETDEVKEQVNSLPNIIRKRINFDKIVGKINDAVRDSIGYRQYAKVTKGEKVARIDIYDRETAAITESDIALKKLFNV